MGRKSEQQLNLEERYRLWKDRERKARTHKQRVECARVLKDIEARLWPSDLDLALAQARVEKLRAKAAKVAAAEAKKAQDASFALVVERERRKAWEEQGCVPDAIKRVLVQAKQGRERDEEREVIDLKHLCPRRKTWGVNGDIH